MDKTNLFGVKITQITKDNTFKTFPTKILGLCRISGIPVTIEVTKTMDEEDPINLKYYVQGHEVREYMDFEIDNRSLVWYKRIWYALFGIKKTQSFPINTPEFLECVHYGNSIKSILLEEPFEFEKILLRGVYSPARMDIIFYGANSQDYDKLKPLTIHEFDYLKNLLKLKTFPELFNRKFKSHSDLVKFVNNIFETKEYSRKSKLVNGIDIHQVILRDDVNNQAFSMENKEF